LENVIKEVQQLFIDTVNDDRISRNTIESKSKILQRYVIPAMEKINTSILKSSRDLSPIACLKRASDRMDNASTKAIIDSSSKKRKTRDIQVLEAYVTAAKSPRAIKRVIRKELPRRGKAVSSKIAGVPICLPPPVDGKQYNKLEMCSILEALDTGIYSKQRGKAIAEMIRLKYVPCKKSAIYNLLKKRRDGKPIMNPDWISAGRPPLLDSKSMDAIVEKIKEHQGRAVGADDLSKMIVLQRKEMVAEAGFSPVGVPDELKTTTRLAYTAEFALRQDVSIVNKTI
jgi:hypothetical protein